MIFAIWRTWVERRQWWWLALIALVILADLLLAAFIIKLEGRLFELLLGLPYVRDGR